MHILEPIFAEKTSKILLILLYIFSYRWPSSVFVENLSSTLLANRLWWFCCLPRVWRAISLWWIAKKSRSTIKVKLFSHQTNSKFILFCWFYSDFFQVCLNNRTPAFTLNLSTDLAFKNVRFIMVAELTPESVRVVML